MDKTNTPAARRSVAAATLACSAERIGSEHEARTAGATAGRLVLTAGLSLDWLSSQVPALLTLPGHAWEGAVDAYHSR